MSLAIETAEVTAVLLGDGWHEVADSSFDLDSYEYIHGTDSRGDTVLAHGGGQSGVCATGYVFKEPDGTFTYGPLTAILAVRAGDMG